MKQELIDQLREKITWCEDYASSNRPGNVLHERYVFNREKRQLLFPENTVMEDAAQVVFDKFLPDGTFSGECLFSFFHQAGKWWYLVPTETHALVMGETPRCLSIIDGRKMDDRL